MMFSDKNLERISFFLTIIGIISLYFIVQNIEPQDTAILSVTGELIGRQVLVSGIIKEKPYWHSDGHLFLTLQQNGSQIKVVMFDREARKYPGLKNLTKGMNISVTGSVDEYEGELEIVAKRIER
jgi:DNA/RNA endonuclease YhcR with UshA esterase domain